MEAIRDGDIPGVQLRRRAFVPNLSAAELWPNLVEPKLLGEWLADRAELEEGASDRFHLERLWQGNLIREQAEVLSMDEPKRLVIGLREIDGAGNPGTIVTFELTPAEGGCEVMVFQEGFQQLPLSVCLTAWEHARTRWTEALKRLAARA